MTDLAPHGGCNWEGCKVCFPHLQRGKTMAARKITVTISASSHPDYDLFMDVRYANGRQARALRGSQKYIDAAYDALANEARKDGFEVELINK